MTFIALMRVGIALMVIGMLALTITGVVAERRGVNWPFTSDDDGPIAVNEAIVFAMRVLAVVAVSCAAAACGIAGIMLADYVSTGTVWLESEQLALIAFAYAVVAVGGAIAADNLEPLHGQRAVIDALRGEA